MFFSRRLRALTAGPQPPENVRVVLDDGREIPVECVYAGVRDGLHEWVAVHRTAGEPASLRIGVLPPRSTIRVGFEGETP